MLLKNLRLILFLISAIFLISSCTNSSSKAGKNISTGSEDTSDITEPKDPPNFSLEFLTNCLNDPKFSTDCPDLKIDEVEKSFVTAPTDILFILDESCSMATIANNMRLGFGSLQQNQYPDNTKMGVTYMSPVWREASGVLDFDRPYHKNVNTKLPGHLKMVTSSSISDYISAVPTHASSYPMTACNSEWFSPDAKNSQGDFCLDAAVQLAPVCTGIEAGLVTLEQIMAKYNQSGKRLFRDKAFVNIIMVSDTHEAGANYFARDGAPAAMRGLEEILSLIGTNSPGLSSIKIGGIVPLPIEGDPFLNDLKVIGDIPQNATEAKINGEGFWDYSYLTIIKYLGGSASHAKSNDWSAMAQSLIDDTKYTGTILVKLDSVATTVYAVLVNGELIHPSQYFLLSDRFTVSLRHSSPTNIDLDIDVIYD